MFWKLRKRIVELEAQVAKLRTQVDALYRTQLAHHKRLKVLESK